MGTNITPSGALSGPLRFTLLVIVVETALVCLMLLEAAVFWLLGSPCVSPSAIHSAAAVKVAMPADGAQQLMLVRSLRAGSQAGYRHHLALCRPQNDAGRATPLPWVHGQPLSVACSGADNVAAVGCEDGAIWLVDLTNHARPPRWLGNARAGSVNELAFSPDGRLLASHSRSFSVWRVATGEKLAELPPKPYIFSSFAFTPDCQQMLLGGADGTLWLWELRDCGSRQLFARCEGAVVHAAVSPDGRFVAAVTSTSDGGVLHVFRRETRQLLWQYDHGRTCQVSPVAFLNNGATVAAVVRDGPRSFSLALLDANTGACGGRLPGHTRHVLGLAGVRQDALCSWSLDGTIRTWNLRLRQERHCCRAEAACASG